MHQNFCSAFLLLSRPKIYICGMHIFNKERLWVSSTLFIFAGCLMCIFNTKFDLFFVFYAECEQIIRDRLVMKYKTAVKTINKNFEQKALKNTLKLPNAPLRQMNMPLED